MRRHAGLLLWSIALMREGRALAAAAVYAVLVNMKHLFLCLAPLYLLYLLSSKCRYSSGFLEATVHPDALVAAGRCPQLCSSCVGAQSMVERLV